MHHIRSLIACAALALALTPAVCLADEIPASADDALASVPAATNAAEATPTSDGADAPLAGVEPVAGSNTTAESADDGATTVDETPAATAEPDAEDSPESEAAPDSPALNEDAELDAAPTQDEVANGRVDAVATADTTSPAATPEPVSKPIAAATPAQAPAVAAAAPETAPTSKQAMKAKPKAQAVETATETSSYLIDNAVYYISTLLKKKGAFVVSAANTSGANKTNVTLSKTKTQLSQFWRAIDRGNNIYRFKNYTGNCYLAVTGTVKQRANVNIAKSGIIDWQLIKNSDGSFSLKPVAKKTAYLSVANAKAVKGANIQLFTTIANKGQKFAFTQNKKLTKAYKVGKTVKPGACKVGLANTTLKLGIAKSAVNDNAKARTVATSKLSSQVFQLAYAGNGLYEFKNANSFKSIAIAKSSKKAGAKVVQQASTKSLNQLWYLETTDAGHRIVSALSGLAIDVDGQKAAKGKNLVMAKRSDAATQQFAFEDAQLVADGVYAVQSAMAAPFVLGLPAGKKDNGTNVQLNRSTGFANEMFKIKHLGDGVYRIVSKSAKKSLDIADASKKNGANVQIGTSANADGQKWIIGIGSQGLTFKSVLSGKYLNVASTQAKNGANVNQRKASDSASQCWNLMPENWSFYAGASADAMKLIVKAETYEGWRYQWGGRSPSTSFDCAGLVMYCSNKAWGTHFDLMNTNAEMLYGKCKHIKASEAKPGDLVFYRGTYGGINYISHVVIYTGHGYMYGAGDPIGYARVDSIKNMKGKTATAVYARIKH